MKSAVAELLCKNGANIQSSGNLRYLKVNYKVVPIRLEYDPDQRSTIHHLTCSECLSKVRVKVYGAQAKGTLAQEGYFCGFLLMGCLLLAGYFALFYLFNNSFGDNFILQWLLFLILAGFCGYVGIGYLTRIARCKEHGWSKIVLLDWIGLAVPPDIQVRSHLLQNPKIEG